MRNHVVVHALFNRERLVLRRAYITFIARLRRGSMMIAMRNRDARAAMKALEPELRDFASQLSHSFRRAREFERRQLERQVRIRKAAPTRIAKQPPRPGDEEAARIMGDAELEFIKDFTDDQRELVRSVLANALDRGLSPTAAARAFRDSIGLTANQAAIVSGYRALLERGSSEALNRELRDARFDRTVTGAIERGDVLTSTQIDRMVSAYSDNMLANRADTIAITESHAAVSQGRRQALGDLMDEFDIGEGNLIRTWNTTKDGRQRDTHDEMDGQQVRGFELYLSPSGARLRFPGDPEAPPEEIIRCRCVETYDILPDEEAAQ